MNKKKTKPRHLYAIDYEWVEEDEDALGRTVKWTTWSWAWSDDGSSMEYVLQKSQGRYKLYFEGDQLGPKQGYTTMNRAAAALAKMENSIRLRNWTEWMETKEKKRR